MNKILLVAALGSLAMSAHASSAETVFDMLEKTGAKITSGSIVDQYQGGLTIEDFTFERFLNRFTAKKLVIEGSVHRFEDVRVEAMQRGDGVIHADRVVLDGEESLWALYTMGGFVPSRDEFGGPVFSRSPEEAEENLEYWEPDCAGLVTNGRASRKMDVTGLVIQGDLDSMPMGFSYGERFDAGSLTATFEFTRQNDTCDMKADVTSRNVRVTSFSGDFLGADHLAMGWSGSADIESGEGVLGRRFLMQDIVLESAAGTRSLTLDEISFKVDQNSIWSGFSCTVIMGVDVFPVLDFNEAFSKGSYDVSFDLLGLDIDVDAFFPPDLIRDLGIGHLNSLTGEISAQSSLNSGISDLHAKIKLSEIIDLSFRAEISYPETRSAALPAMIGSNIPLPAEVLQLNVHNMNVFYDDQGIGTIARHLTGHSTEALFDLGYAAVKSRFTDKIPVFMTGRIDNIAAMISAFIRDGGNFRISPKQPMNMMALGMQVLLSSGPPSKESGISFKPVE